MTVGLYKQHYCSITHAVIRGWLFFCLETNRNTRMCLKTCWNEQGFWRIYSSNNTGTPTSVNISTWSCVQRDSSHSRSVKQMCKTSLVHEKISLASMTFLCEAKKREVNLCPNPSIFSFTISPVRKQLLLSAGSLSMERDFGWQFKLGLFVFLCNLKMRIGIHNKIRMAWNHCTRHYIEHTHTHLRQHNAITITIHTFHT